MYVRGDTVSFHGSIAAWIVEDQKDSKVDGMVKVRMVGDDRDFYADLDRVEPIEDDEFCGGCGQVGCCHG